MVELPVVYAMGSSGILICMKTLLEIFDECVLIFPSVVFIIVVLLEIPFNLFDSVDFFVDFINSFAFNG